MTMSGHDLLWEINCKEKSLLSLMIPKYHRCASIPCTDCCGNSPTPTRTRPPPFSWLHFFSLYLFPTLYQWLEYLCGFLPSTVASSCRQLSQVWQRQFKTCSLFQEKPQPPKPRWDPTSSQTALLCPCKDTETPWFNVFSSACQGFTSYPLAPTTSLVLHFPALLPLLPAHLCSNYHPQTQRWQLFITNS